MKVNELVEIIRKEVRKAVREELKSILLEGLPAKQQDTSMRKTLKESFSNNKQQSPKNIPKPKFTNPLDEMLYETQNELVSARQQALDESMPDEEFYQEMSTPLDEIKNNMAAKFGLSVQNNTSIAPSPRAPRPATVSDMLTKTNVARTTMIAEGVPDASAVGNIDVIPDFSAMMSALKTKGKI